MGLEIYTWKSGSKGLGFTNPVKSMLLGGNVGHAAVELTFPADEEGNKLAKKYQDVPGLSIGKRTEIVPEKQNNGSYLPKEQVSYFVYFSWWPGHTNGHHINSHKADLEAEWRHEPAHKLKPEVHNHIFGEDIPAANKTNVKGMLVSEKTITKINEFSHPHLMKNFENDPAHRELKAEEAVLKAEWQTLNAKGEIYSQELINSRIEKREPNRELNLTDKDIQRLAEISRELKRMEQQIELCKTDFQERHTSVGEAPSSVVRIPVTNDRNAPAFALDAEKVLDKMATLAQSTTAYSFYKFNCSTSATQVVKAGISDELKTTMKTDGFNVENASKATISTPTSFSHFSQQIQAKLIHLNTKVSPVKQQENQAAEQPSVTQSFKARLQETKEKEAEFEVGLKEVEEETIEEEMKLSCNF